MGSAEKQGLKLVHRIHRAVSPGGQAPLVIAHGLFGSGRNFNVIGRNLAARRDVVLVDMRNHGDSPWDETMDYPAMAADLARIIEEECAGQAVVLGHSMGGKAAMALALMHPQRVAGLIVGDIAPVAYDHGHLDLIQAMQAMDIGAVHRRSQADPLLAGAVPDPMLRGFLLQNLVVADGQARWRLNLDVLARRISDILGWPADLANRVYAGPVLFVHGDASPYLDQTMAPVITGLFPQARIQTIPGAGHWLHADRPQEFLDAVGGFLAERDG